MKEGSLCVCLFCLSCWDLSNHSTSCCTLGPVGKPSRTRGAPSWFHNVLTYNGEVINIEQKYRWLSVWVLYTLLTYQPSLFSTDLHTHLGCRFLYKSFHPKSPSLWALLWSSDRCFIPNLWKAVKWAKLGTDTWDLGINSEDVGSYFDEAAWRCR